MSSILPGSTESPQDFRQFCDDVGITDASRFGRTKQVLAQNGTQWRDQIRAVAGAAIHRLIVRKR